MIRRSLTLAFLALLVFVGAVSAQNGDTKRVALVIQFPDSVHQEIVTVPADANAADVLEAATIPVALSAQDVGVAVCNINGVGNPVDDCFADPDEFWAYFHLEGDAWQAAQTGVSDYTPADGAVEGFAWSGFDASFNPTIQPPLTTFAAVSAQAEAETAAETPTASASSNTLTLFGFGLLLLILVGVGVWALRRQRAG